MSTTTATSGTTSNAPISFSGLASGLDTTSIIQKLVSLDSAPVTAMQTQQTTIQSQESTYSQLATYLQSFQADAKTLSSSQTFNSVAASSSNTAVATITSSTGALAGSYNLTVNQLAQAQKLVSGSQTDTTSSLNLAGTIEINGKSVSVAANQSLTSIAQSINNLGAGVTAGIVDGGKGNAYLSLTSTQTGASNALQLADMSGNVLQSLGITNGTTGVRNSTSSGANSFGFSSQTATLQSLIGSTASGSVTVNGSTIPIDLNTDSLQSIATKINQSSGGASASVVTSTANGKTSYALQIAGTGGAAPTFTDAGNVLQSIGILQQGAQNELVQAKDASFKLDSATITSPTNTITTAIPDASITLLQGTSASPGTSTLSLTPSTTATTTALQSFVSDYNQVADYISSNSQINTQTFATGSLFGDPVASQISSRLTSTLFQNVPGLTGTYTSLASLGMTLNQSGDLSLNTDTLNAALASNPSQVAAIFQATGTGSNSNISYVSSGSSTAASGTSGYPVSISQLATKGEYIAGTAQTSPSANAETLTFGGALLSNQPYSLITKVGGTLQNTVDQINADSKLNLLLTASISSTGTLQIDSKKFGTPGNFTIQSNEGAASDTTGVGSTSQTPTTAGLDLAGTINGEATTGNGQFLTGNTGNSKTDGLEIGYTGTTTGAVGSLTFSSGIASQLTSLLTEFTDPSKGLLATATTGLQTQYTNIGKDITDLNTQLAAETANLTAEFNNMESSIATLQAQSKSLSALLGTSSSSSSGSSSSSSSSSSGSSGTTHA